MKRTLTVRLSLVVMVLQLLSPRIPAADAQSHTTPPVTIVRLDPRFDKLLPHSATVEKIADGFAWVEGPVWNRKENFLLFSDIPHNAIIKWQEGNSTSVFLKPSGLSGTSAFPGQEPGSNGLAFDQSGRLIICEHGDRRISRLEADGKKTTLVDRYHGKRLNSPNDLTFTPNGDLYFTDPPFGLPKAFTDPARELDFCGVYRLSANGTLTLMAKEMTAPNGIAFSPDGKKAYVSNADAAKAVWMVYDVQDDGAFTNGRVFFDATAWTKTKKGVPDGIKIDNAGNLFTAGPGGIHVISPEGTLLGSFETGVPTANCAWGNDGRTLYIAANTAIFRVKTNTRGIGF